MKKISKKPVDMMGCHFLCTPVVPADSVDNSLGMPELDIVVSGQWLLFGPQCHKNLKKKW